MNTIYGVYTSDGLTRETMGERGRNVAQSGGDADFFALTKINFWGRSEKTFGARKQRDAQRGRSVVGAGRIHKENKKQWTTSP